MSDFESLMRKLTSRLTEQDNEIEDLKRRLNNIVREGVCGPVDHKSGKARVKTGNLDSPALPWAQRSGEQQEYDPPTEGERIILLSPSGDPSQGIIFQGGYSDKFKQPYDKPASWFRRVGDSSIVMDKERITLMHDEAQIELSKSGIELKIGSSSFKLTKNEINLVATKFNANKA